MEIPVTGGLGELRKAISRHLSSFRGLLADPDDPESLLSTLHLGDVEKLTANGTISGGPFVNRLWNLMEWKPGHRYTVFGDLAPVRLVNDEPTLVFDLEDSCMSDSYKRKGAKQHERKQPHPADHSEQFGLGIRAEELLQG